MAVLAVGTLVLIGPPAHKPDPVQVTIRNGKSKVEPKVTPKAEPKVEKKAEAVIPRDDAEYAMRVLNTVGAVGALGFCQIVGVLPETIKVPDIIPKLVEITKGYEARNDGLAIVAKYAPQLFAHALEGNFVVHSLQADGVTVNRVVTQIATPEICKQVEEVVKKEQAPGGIIAGVAVPGRKATLDLKQ